MSKKRILIQLDTDPHASVFDGVVAVDSGADFLFQYSNVKPDGVRALVHGAMFTRGPADLHSTAVFVGGSDIEAGYKVAEAAKQACFNPFSVSIMHDSNGCNSTAAAAVLCADKHVDFSRVRTLVLAATGAVGKTVCKLIAGTGGHVVIASRKLTRAEECCEELADMGISKSLLSPLAIEDPLAVEAALKSVEVAIACGAAGAELLTAEQLAHAKQIQVAIDLNAVPPAGLQGIDLTDTAVRRGNRIDYGALGVGGLKMKIHKASIREMFSDNQQFIDAQRMIEIGRECLKS